MQLKLKESVNGENYMNQKYMDVSLNTTDKWQQTTSTSFSDVHTTHAMFYVADFIVLNIGTSDIAELS
jgi:hypothetical protein